MAPKKQAARKIPVLLKVYMTPELKQQLREFAAKQPTSMNDVAVQAIQQSIGVN